MNTVEKDAIYSYIDITYLEFVTKTLTGQHMEEKLTKMRTHIPIQPEKSPWPTMEP